METKMELYVEDELNVFKIPHCRMKQLVQSYSNKVSCTDFSSHVATESLLRILSRTFEEFKLHETIENEFIVWRLRDELQDLDECQYKSVVCNCHSDNRLSEMLQLVRDGHAYTRRSASERVAYGRRLEAALDDFTKVFLPHMEEEEAVFQPLLAKFLGHEELKTLKEKILEQHEKLKPSAEPVDDCNSKEDGEGNEKFRLEEVVDSKPDIDWQVPEVAESPFESVPLEVTLKIFSYLSPPDLGRCGKVCRAWRFASRQPSLWHRLLPAQWARDDWSNAEDGGYYPEEDELFDGGTCVIGCHGHQCNECRIRDEDADVDESCCYTNEDFEDFSCHRLSRSGKERTILEGITEHLLPRIGSAVRHLSLAGCSSLQGKWLSQFVSECPGLLHLDLSYTNLNDENVKLMLRDLACCHRRPLVPRSAALQHLDLSGCSALSDFGFCSLIAGLLLGGPPKHIPRERKMKRDLQVLKLSGCSSLTDETLRFLSVTTDLSSSLQHIDLSGCWLMSGLALTLFVQVCPELQPEELFYCDRIIDGPYQESANGCQNLGSRTRFCCCSGE